MSTVSQPSSAIPKSRRLPPDLLVRNMWAGLGIIVMWLAVLLDALIGPDMHFVSSNGGGSSNTTIPSAVVVALFAWLATRAVAKYGFYSGEHDPD